MCKIAILSMTTDYDVSCGVMTSLTDCLEGEPLCKGENPHSNTNLSEISKDNTAPQWARTFPSAQIIFSTFHSSQVQKCPLKFLFYS